jgi:hypothetical protein
MLLLHSSTDGAIFEVDAMKTAQLVVDHTWDRTPEHPLCNTPSNLSPALHSHALAEHL